MTDRAALVGAILPPIMCEARRREGSRVHIHYTTRTTDHHGLTYPVWGANELGVDEHAVAHVVARIIGSSTTHVFVQPDHQPRPVAIHARSIKSITDVPRRTQG